MSTLLRTCHPEPVAVVTLVVIGLGVGVGVAAPRLLLLGAAILCGQLSIGWSNDWLDHRRGHDAGRTDKPLALDGADARRVGGAAVIAAGLAIVLSVLLGPVPGALHMGAVALGWAYNILLKGTWASVLAYVVAFGLLPWIVTATAGAGVPRWWAFVAAACFGAGVHLANALPDLDGDIRAGVRGLPQRLGGAASVALAVVLIACGALAALLGPAAQGARSTGSIAVAAVGLVLVSGVLVVVVLAARRGRMRTAFRAAMAAGVLVVLALVLQGGQIPR